MENFIFENTNWKTTRYGSKISLYSSKENIKDLQKPILILGGVHGDEPEGVHLCQSLLHHLKTVSRMSHQDWLLIPCLNPDGFFKNERVNGNGVDLNRNFPSQDWSSHIKAPRYNPGTSPGSEVETQAVVELITETAPKLIIHCHSWKPSIVYTSTEIPKEASILSLKTGYPLEPDIGYPTPGSLGQYGFYTHHIPVICIEEKEGVNLESIWPRFKDAFDELLFGVE